MERIPTSPPVIKPLDPSAERPMWSVMIPVYNCAQFLAETLESVMAQNIPAAYMQIEVVDDASSDADVEELVKRIGQDRIKYYRQPVNVGSLRNFETCINRAQGHLVHILHGDDRVVEGYYLAIEKLFKQYPEAGAAFCRHQIIDEDGKVLRISRFLEMQKNGLLDNWLLRIGKCQRLQYVSITVKRVVFEKLGGFYGRTYGEDWEMWVRIAKHFPVAYTPKVLAEYRKHTNSISAAKIVTGEYLADIAALINIIQNHIPPEHQEEIRKEAQKNFAHYGMGVANLLWRTSQNKAYVKANLKEIFKLHIDNSLCVKAAKIYVKMMINRH
ncbi:glycosyltransferase [Pontibacter vulgaris]|uniref:glycosyltransferase n=1 Tax=Pontibacter vulgaris TaxID=2905679 RepID=UPI001FA73F2B|nr:glycosyltransferase [Pontibacter vulgaris]